MNSTSPHIGIALVDALVAPSSLFKQFQVNRHYGQYILLAILAFTMFSTYTFFSGMSDQHLLTEQLAQISDLTVSEREIAEGVMLKSLPYTGLFTGGLSVVLLAAQVLLLGLYVLLIARAAVTPFQWRYSDAVSLVSWCYLPVLVSYLGLSLLVFTSSTPDLPMALLNYASLNQIFLHGNIDDPIYNWAQSISIFNLWSIALLFSGFFHAFKLSMLKAMLLSTLPFALFYGVWLFFI